MRLHLRTVGTSAICLVYLLFANVVVAERTPPKILAAGLGKGALVIENGEIIMTYKTDGACQDAWQLDDGSVLVSGTKAVIKYSADGTTMFTYRPAQKGGYQIHSCMPLPEGRSLVAICGPGLLVELSADGKVEKEIVVKDIGDDVHVQMRGVRKNEKGEYLVVAAKEELLVFLDADGVETRRVNYNDIIKAPLKAKKPHGLALLNNGNILLGTAYGACVVEIDKNDKVVWSFSREDAKAAGIEKFNYAAGLQRLPNGNTVIAAYNSGSTLFEVSPDKTVIWKIAANDALGKMTSVQVLGLKGESAIFDLQK